MSEKYKNSRSEKGFTLIELIIVMVILAMLASMVVPKILTKLSEMKSKDARIQIASFDEALTAFVYDVGRLPNQSEGLDALINNTTNSDSWKGPYLKNVLPPDPWGKPYQYRWPGQHGDYDIYSLGPDGQEGTQDDVGTWTQ